MENFVVSARKYRPDSFETVVGQGSITRTLRNAIGTGQVAHAYLFTGPRGVGKTTCARIFAKTINCQNVGEDSEACGVCDSCKAFNDNRSFNIHELDAASNNHVEDIRSLIDQIRIPPQVGKYSIYIIDEVHMLSQQAFNAFLKTLEEPPAHAVFILATTEKHKIIPTILSRCPIFDFKRITVRVMMMHLSNVAQKEGVEVDATSLNIIAQKADGSMRDALSIFDQVVSFSGKKVDSRSVIDNLNVLDYEYYFNMTGALLEGDYKKALTIFDEVLENGFDARNYLNGLGKHFRNLLMGKDQDTIKLMELSGEISDQYRSYAQKCSVDFLFRALDIIGAADISFKTAKDPRLHLEISLLKLTALNMVQIEVKTASPSVIQKPEVKNEKPAAQDEPSVASVTPEEKDDKVAKDSAGSISGEKLEEVKEEVKEEIKEEISEDKPKDKSELAREESKPLPSLSAIKTGPRISDYLNNGNGSGGQAKVEEPDVEEELPIVERELNQENLNELWLSFADNIKEDQPRLYNTLTTQKPLLEEDGTIRLNLNNPLQEKALNSIHSEIVAYVVKSTGNQNVKLETMVEKKNSEKKLYTQEEKFKHMQEKNPELGLFRSTFNLDFD